jgi:very-short-patch-repair endonuclease
MSDLETTLAFHIKVAKLPAPECEYRFHPSRKWRFDFAWPEQKLAAECEGGTWTNGRHTRGVGFENDCIKYNQATINGWRVLRFTKGMIDSGTALDMVELALQEVGNV